MKYQILTPFDYPKEYPHMEERMRIFYKYTYPSVMAQTDKNFEWILVTSGVHTNVEKDLKIPNTISMSKECWLKNAKMCFQTRLDNDDMILPRFVERVKQIAQYGHYVDFKGYRLDVQNKKLYTDKSYNKQNPSPFLSTIAERCIWDIAWHTDMHKHLVPIEVNEKMWVQVIHPNSWTMSKKDCPSLGDYVCEEKDMDKVMI